MLNPNENPEKPSVIQSGVDYIRALFARSEQAKNNPESPSRVDSKGRICPASIISAVDAARDDLVNDTIAQWKAERATLRDIKRSGFAKIDEFLSISLTTYKEKIGGKKGSVTLINFAQTGKIVISYAARITFTEELVDAKNYIDQLIEEKSEHVDDITKALLMNAFNLNDGNVNAYEILKLKRIAIDHPKWKLAIEAINKAILPMESKGYIRVYERANIDSEWEAISLDIAAL